MVNLEIVQMKPKIMSVSKTLAFCLLYLLHHPDSQERIRQEAIDIEQGPYHLLL